MNIGLVSTLSSPVRRINSGSVEYITWTLTRELTRLGHEVTVFGAGGSEVDGALVATVPGSYSDAGVPDDWQLCEWINICKAIELSKNFDIIHSHNYLWGTPMEQLAQCPMIHTLHIMPSNDHNVLRSLYPDAHVTAISSYQWSGHQRWEHQPVIHHGVGSNEFSLQNVPSDYVCFLGRFMPGKGIVEAIQSARALDLKILLGGPRNDYFRTSVEPLVDGSTVEYVGWVYGAERERLLGGARALLYPIRTPEPFGLVMVEAMMCGTPVAAIRTGAVPEIIEDGVNGCFSDTFELYRDAVRRTLALDRRKVRRAAEERFSSDRMAREYLAAYDCRIATWRRPAN